MDSSTIDAGLPASRTDALSIVVLGLISAFMGSMPAEGKTVGVMFTTLSNIWAIVSSVLTFIDNYHNTYDIETHLWLFLLGLLVMTIITSTLTLLSFTVKKADSVFACAYLIGMLAVLTIFVFGLVELIVTHTVGCTNDVYLHSSALCQHKTGYVVGVIVGVGVGGLILGCLLVLCIAGNAFREEKSGDVEEGGAYSQAKDQSSTQGLEVFFGASLMRTSALAKACLLGVYWFLVDGDMKWDSTVNGIDVSWWTTGQWAKQSVAIANTFFNCCC